MPDAKTDTRPGLAIVVNSITPYGTNLQRLIAAGVPEFKVHVLVTHWATDFKWQVEIPPELNLTRYAAPGEHPYESPLRRPWWDWRKGGRMIRYLRENRIQAAIFTDYHFISLLRLMNYCHRAGIPFLVNQDSNIRSERPLSPLKRFTKRQMYAWWLKRASAVLSMGTLGDQFFIKYGADPNRFYRVPYWPDYDAFTVADNERLARFRQRFGLNQQRHYLLFSGRLVPEKRVDLLIDAFAATAGDRPDWDLLIVGEGVLGEELHRRVPEGLRRRVVWTGFLEGQELSTAFHAADVLVLPSDFEPWALVVQEAMAAGLAVISSDASGAAYELIDDGRSGRIFPVGGLEQLQRAILDITANDALPVYKQASAAALAKWRSEIDPVAEIRRALRDAAVLSFETPRPFSTTVDFQNAQ